MKQKFFLTIKEIFSNRFVSLIVFLAICFTVIAGSFFELLNNSVNRYVGERFTESIPPDTIRVTRRQAGSSLIFGLGSGGRRSMDEKMLRGLRRMKGVSRVDPVMSLRVPMQARISFFGFSYRTDLVVIGVPYGMVSRDINGADRKRLWRSAGPGTPVPVLVPETVLNAYNDGIAEQNGLPVISGKSVVGMRFKLLIGHSSLLSLDGNEQVDAEISGFTGAVRDLALVVPLNRARYYNRKFGRGSASYTSAYVQVRDHPSLLSVSSRLAKTGFIAETGKTLSREMLKLKRNVSMLSRSLLYIILFLSAAAVAFSTVIATQSRLEYYRIMRILGASRMFITFTVIVKYAVIGCAASGTGLLAVHFLSGMARELLPVAGGVISAGDISSLYADILLWGTLIPVLSTIPGLVRLHTRGLDRD